jgi:hypothetical protein
MFAAICGTLATGAGLLTVLRTPSRSRQVQASEESAHALAAGKRQARREARYRSERSGTVSPLDDTAGQSACRILDASRSGLRIASARQFSKGSQVCVQWGGEFFVGVVLYTVASQAEYVAGLELLTGNHRWHPLEKLCFWRRFAGSRA